MPMQVTFELTNKDLVHFRTLMREARVAAGEQTEQMIIGAAEGLLEDVGAVKVPAFVTERLRKLKLMIDMLRDEQWRLPKRERGRVLNALSYFTEPDDLIPDHIPGLGFLDDAIMIELVVRALDHEIEAYEDFSRFLDDESQRDAIQERATAERRARVEKRRRQLLERMRRRGTRDRRLRRSAARPRLRLF